MWPGWRSSNHSSGDKSKLLGISKRVANIYARSSSTALGLFPAKNSILALPIALSNSGHRAGFLAMMRSCFLCAPGRNLCLAPSPSHPLTFDGLARKGPERARLSHALFDYGRRRPFKKPPQLRRRPELRDRIKFFECRRERVRQTPHGSGLELLMLRIEIEIVHLSAPSVSGRPTHLQRTPGRSSVFPPLLRAVGLANFPPAAAWVQSSAASGPRRSRVCLRATSASSALLKRG